MLLAVLDRKWREHLYEMDYLREGIGLRAYSQRDPLVEYQREGFELFQAMMESIKEEAVGFLFHVEVQTEQPVDPAEAELQNAAAALVAGGPSAATAATTVTESDSESDSRRAARCRGRRRATPYRRWNRPTPVADHRPHIRAKGLEAPRQPKNLSYSAPTLDGDAGTEVHQDGRTTSTQVRPATSPVRVGRARSTRSATETRLVGTPRTASPSCADGRAVS